MRKVKWLGLPFHFGQGNKGVADASPFLRATGLTQRINEILPLEDLDDLVFHLQQEYDTSIRFERTVARACQQISTIIEALNLSETFLISIGGDHGLALGSIHGVLAQNPETVVVWVDAHGDLNSPAVSPSGNFHGMPLAFLMDHAGHHEAFGWMKHKLSPKKLILLGPRSIDPGERSLIDELGIAYYSSEEVRAQGVDAVLKKALKQVDPAGTSPIHLSFDVDALDPEAFPSTGTLVSHGLSVDEVKSISTLLGRTGRLRSMDLVEFNPCIGTPEDIRISFEHLEDLLVATLKSL